MLNLLNVSWDLSDPKTIVMIVAIVVIVVSVAMIIGVVIHNYLRAKKSKDTVTAEVETDSVALSEGGQEKVEDQPAEETVETVSETADGVVAESVDDNICNNCDDAVADIASQEEVCADDAAEPAAAVTEDIADQAPVSETVAEADAVAEAEDSVRPKRKYEKKSNLVPFIDCMLTTTDKLKGFYNQLKGELMSYNGVKSSLTNKCEVFRIDGTVIAKIAKREKLEIAFASKNVEETAKKYLVDVSAEKMYEKTPIVFIVKSQATAKLMIELMADDLAKDYGLVKKSKVKDVDWMAKLAEEKESGSQTE